MLFAAKLDHVVDGENIFKTVGILSMRTYVYHSVVEHSKARITYAGLDGITTDKINLSYEILEAIHTLVTKPGSPYAGLVVDLTSEGCAAWRELWADKKSVLRTMLPVIPPRPQSGFQP